MSEFDLQKFAVQLLTLYAADDVIFFAVPNGEARSARTGAKLKAMGVKPGVGDLAVVCPGGRVRFLELKTATGSLSQSQRAFRTLCEFNGCPYEVATTPEEVESILRGWGALRSTRVPVLASRAAEKKAA